MVARGETCLSHLDVGSIYKRFNAWSLSSKWGRVFKALTIEPDWEWEFIDGNYVKAHWHSAGAVGQENRRPLVKVVQGIPQRFTWWLIVMACPSSLKLPVEKVNDCSVALQLIARLLDVEVIVAAMIVSLYESR